MISRSTASAILSHEPARPDRVVAEVAALDDAAVDTAIVRAAAAAPEWAAQAVLRSTGLNRWAQAIEGESETLATLVAREVGKTIRESRVEVARAAAIIRYYSQAAFDPIAEILPSADGRAQLTVQRLPLGVVAAICPWNFPLAIPVWKLAPALAYGNAVIFKPASAAVGVGQRLVELARPAISDEILVFAPVLAGGARRLLDDPRIAGVSFTGSSDVGRAIVARVAERGGSVQAEMGGQNASIVLDDANLERAVATIANAAMGYAGQKCTATRRVVVDESIADVFVGRLTDRIGGLVVGDPLAETTDVGPVIDAGARATVERAVEGAVSRGARVLVGGSAPDGSGWFYRPTVLAIDDPTDPFVHDETFGPVVAILVARSDDEAVRIANGTHYGLAAAVFGSDLTRATKLAQRLEAGMVRVNESTTGADFWAPFGGERASSYGPREQGREAREFYTKTRTLSVAEGH